MKAIELVILIVAVAVLIMALAASVIASDNTSFLNIGFPSHQTQEPRLGYGDTDTGVGHALCIAIDAITGES